MNRVRPYIVIAFMWLLLFSNNGLFSSTLIKRKSVTIRATNTPLREVLAEISQQTGINFIFYDKLVDNKNITINVKEVSAQEVLDKIFQSVNLSYKIVPSRSIVIYPKRDEDALFSIVNTNNTIKFPTLQYMVENKYPPLAELSGLEGKVGVQFLVNKYGDVDSVIVTEPSEYKILDNAAVMFVKKLKFNPAKQGDENVDVWMSLVLNYELNKKGLPNMYFKNK